MPVPAEDKRKLNENAGWLDISVSLTDGMVRWPGDPEVKIQQVSDVERGDSHTLSAISMGSHTGTHIDAPRHFIRGGMSIDEMPLDVCIGRARVLEIHNLKEIRIEELLPYHIRQGERILFKTHNSAHKWWTVPFMEDFVYLEYEAAKLLVERKVKLVGIDYLSIGSFKHDGSSIHQILLGDGIWIIEGLNLSQVSSGKYDLVCLPLRLEKSDGAPARVVVRRK